MKEFMVKINKIFIDKKIIILNELNINQYTKLNTLTKLTNEINDLKPTQIVIPGNLYSFNSYNIFNEEKINHFLDNLSSICDTYYIKGINDYNNHINIKKHNNLYMLCDLNDNEYNKKYHINGVNFYGIRFGKTYYNNDINQKISDLIYKYCSYFETIHPKDNDVNILLCYDALIKYLYDYSDNLQKFDIVITSNNYHEKEQLVQKGTTLFFLSDIMNKESIFKTKQPNIDNIDILNCEYHKARSLIKKK